MQEPNRTKKVENKTKIHRMHTHKILFPYYACEKVKKWKSEKHIRMQENKWEYAWFYSHCKHQTYHHSNQFSQPQNGIFAHAYMVWWLLFFCDFLFFSFSSSVIAWHYIYIDMSSCITRDNSKKTHTHAISKQNDSRN